MRNQSRDGRAGAVPGRGRGRGRGRVRAEGTGRETSDVRLQTSDCWHLDWATRVRMA